MESTLGRPGCKRRFVVEKVVDVRGSTLRSKFGEQAAIEGTVIDVMPVADGRAVNLLLAPKESGVLIWIDWNAKPLFDDKYGGHPPASECWVSAREGTLEASKWSDRPN